MGRRPVGGQKERGVSVDAFQQRLDGREGGAVEPSSAAAAAAGAEFCALSSEIELV